jgi:cyclopropane fatty-acyl-phospholipid synthase-like methyltransferase
MTYQAAESASNRIHDELAPRYGYAVDANLAAQLKYRLVLRHLPPDARVLDVCCANGLHLRVVAPHSREIAGVHIDARMLDLARGVVATMASLTPRYVR